MHYSNSKQNYQVPPDLLDDIASRFILDAADSVLQDPIALCFLTEQAYWFYLDEYVEERKDLNFLKMDAFSIQYFKHIGITPPGGGTYETMLQNFKEFKQSVPTYGGLLINEDMTHALLVQGFYHKDSWSFPKGKINHGEEPHKCAIREVMEETGYDISKLIKSDLYIDNIIGEQKIRLYIIHGVPMDTNFMPQTKGEIKEHRWFPINQLPTHRNDRTAGNFSKMFYMAIPFIKPLKEWVATQVKYKGRIGNDKNSKSRSNTPSARNNSNTQEKASMAIPVERMQEKSRQKFVFTNQNFLTAPSPNGDILSGIKPFIPHAWKFFQLDISNVFPEVE